MVGSSIDRWPRLAPTGSAGSACDTTNEISVMPIISGSIMSSRCPMRRCIRPYFPAGDARSRLRQHVRVHPPVRIPGVVANIRARGDVHARLDDRRPRAVLHQVILYLLPFLGPLGVVGLDVDLIPQLLNGCVRGGIGPIGTLPNNTLRQKRQIVVGVEVIRTP